MPGVQSLQAQQYYAHPRNAFWPIMANYFGFKVDSSYQRRCLALTGRGLAVWDVLRACVRPGSLDASIRSATEVPNDFADLLETHPIRTIVFNGAKAEASFKRHVQPQLDLGNIRLVRLPSTSPAHAAMAQVEKQTVWSAALLAAGLS